MGKVEDEVAAILFASEDPIQRGKGVLLRAGAMETFRKSFDLGEKEGINSADMRLAGVHVLATLLLYLSGPSSLARLLMYHEFVEIYLAMGGKDDKSE